MKTIEPVKVWNNGAEVDATILNLSCMNDNLKDNATFNYQLMRKGDSSQPGGAYMPMQSLVSGSLNMSGADYDAWETNDYAYEWAAKKLNLVITGEYVPPTPVPPAPVPPAPIEPVTEPTTEG